MPFCAALELFPSQSALEAGEQRLRAAPQDLQLQLFVAWALRQRDMPRALAMADTLEAQSAALAEPERRCLRLRLQLLRAEAALLYAQLEQVEPQLAAIRAEALLLGELAVQADAAWLAQGLASMRGDFASEQRELLAAAAAAEQAGDALRLLIFRAELGRSSAFQDNLKAEQDWGPLLPAELAGLAPAARAAVADFRGVLAALRADYEACIASFGAAFEAALESGQLRRAIALASNLGFNYGNMADYETALAWLQRGLELARGAGWPSLVGGCLMHVGEVLRHLGQLDAAREALQEAKQVLSPLPHGRNQAVRLNVLARIELESARYAEALAAYEEMAALPSAAAADLRVIAGIGRARALLGLGRVAEAATGIQQTLSRARAQHNRNYEIEALWAQADIALALEPHGPAALGWYEQALAQAATLPAYRPHAALLEAASAAQAAQGRFERAYALAQEASANRQRHFSEEATRRMTGLRAQHQMERARVEHEHLRRNHELLLHLSSISQEITTELQAERIFEALERLVHTMLDAQSVAIYTLDEAGGQLVCSFGMEAGQAFVDPPIALDSPNSYCARALRERREFVLGAGELADPHSEVPGTRAMLSMMFVPLRLSERMLGVMTVQSERAAAYGEREQLILRMLCSYGAIALENARAYQRLGTLQQQLMAQEKLAALGAMVAGVAHELNTPIGNSLLVASTVLAATDALAERVEQPQPMRRAELQAYLRQAREGLAVIERSMQGAGTLVSSFKQVAVDRSAEQRRLFSVAEVCEQCAQTLGVALRQAGIGLQLQLEKALQLDAYPGALGQVLVILMSNALTHAFAGRAGGTLTLELHALTGERISLSVADDGVGMSEAVRRRVFEPFFTTRFGQGGSGLGLSIAHNIVESLLGGQLRVSSTPGQGSCFTLELPLRAP
jgi:signal transduction histidine kinase